MADAARAKQRDAWAHTSLLIAMVGNFHAGRDVYRADRFDPTVKQMRSRGVPIDEASFDVVCEAFLGHKPSWCE